MRSPRLFPFEPQKSPALRACGSLARSHSPPPGSCQRPRQSSPPEVSRDSRGFLSAPDLIKPREISVGSEPSISREISALVSFSASSNLARSPQAGPRRHLARNPLPFPLQLFESLAGAPSTYREISAPLPSSVSSNHARSHRAPPPPPSTPRTVNLARSSSEPTLARSPRLPPLSPPHSPNPGTSGGGGGKSREISFGASLFWRLRRRHFAARGLRGSDSISRDPPTRGGRGEGRRCAARVEGGRGGEGGG